ncbi:MAG: AzlD domain-containing protein [Gammaproteobacteria bacterium]|nr:MAG: AzlD domain-containing protein [Gammaproteobacteria bacterium]
MTTETLWIIVLGCGAATFLWRALGVAVVRRIDPQGPLFKWVTCVSYAMVAGLIFRMLILPESELATVPLWLRCTSIAIAFAAYFVAGRRLVAGVLGGGVSLSALMFLVS